MTERHAPFLVPQDEIAARIAALQSGLAAAGIGLAWIEHLTDRIYFTGSAADGALLVPAAAQPVFYVRKSVGRASRESPLDVEPYPGGRKTIEAVAGMLEGGSLGMALDVTQASNYTRIAAAVERIEDISTLVRTLRATKSAWEI
ncbi:MAG: aminopeptidase P family protein, partial [Acidobacteria bacterium]|nr:aminopeptidase P family protein [Acidobacteriota bacterium]NIM61959.1 aminopeptidase P family protein [Acidobacteriota bacterium]NIO58939.1 aminopeptidase P family protein [Acidobacteriota bacterium]NIQ29988.1 aminopeptidase P family protein [Acidobacteriota bacterium]NIQ84759.1 aminopeptidase P family protein [Acidobacteriota bacterium]